MLRHDETLSTPARVQLENLVDILYDASRHLIVYGSLAPNEPNHGQLAELAGTWQDGWVTGDLTQLGWGAAHGYPAIRLRPGGPNVAAKLFVSADLPRHWARLDAFEGEDYRRMLAPFLTSAGIAAVGNIYELKVP